MAHLRKTTLLALAPLLLACPIAVGVFGGLSTSACEAYHNEAERLEYKKAMDAEEAKIRASAGVAGSGSTLPVYSSACQNGVCRPDPGSRSVTKDECKVAEDGLEFLPMPIMDLAGGKCTACYSYHDRTVFNLWPRGWELVDTKADGSTTPMPYDPWHRCDWQQNYVMHVTGGPFREWGGGLGRSLRCSNTSNQATISQFPGDELQKAYCPEINVGLDYGTGMLPVCNPAQKDPLNKSVCPKRDQMAAAGEEVPVDERPLLGQAFDLREWDGVSFWGRRGPNGQAGIRILVGDRYTDDDISFRQYLQDPAAPRYCERTVECRCNDQNKPCHTLTAEDLAGSDFATDANARWPTVGEQICWDPKTDAPLNRDNGAIYQWQICGNTACTWPTASAKSLNAGPPDDTRVGGYYYRDIQFDGMQCLQYSQRGSITSDFCYDPKSSDPRLQKPPEGSQQCGDHWMKSVALDYDWKFYTVRFDELLQQGWAKRSYMLDLTAITMVRITWDRGFADFWVDDVRFYRKKK